MFLTYLLLFTGVIPIMDFYSAIMSTIVSREIGNKGIIVESPTWRIVPESDPERVKKPLFSPTRQTIFWLRTGQNANEKDIAQTREPFITLLLSEEEQTAFENGLQAALALYGNRFVSRTTDDKNLMVVGEYSDQLHRMPAVVIGRSEEGLQILHTWVPATTRDPRLH